MEKRIDEVSKRFLRELETLGITGYKLKKDGIVRSQSTLTNIKSGKQRVSRKTIDACADEYGLDKHYILMGGISNT